MFHGQTGIQEKQSRHCRNQYTASNCNNVNTAEEVHNLELSLKIALAAINVVVCAKQTDHPDSKRSK